MSTAYSIETRRRTAGIAVYDEGSYRFFAAEPLFSSLEGRRYNSVASVERAAILHEQANNGRQGARRQDSRGEVFRSWGLTPLAQDLM
jgi:hypothetical protein